MVYDKCMRCDEMDTLVRLVSSGSKSSLGDSAVAYALSFLITAHRRAAIRHIRNEGTQHGHMCVVSHNSRCKGSNDRLASLGSLDQGYFLPCWKVKVHILLCCWLW